MQLRSDEGLRVTGVTKRYGMTLALAGLDLQASRGVVHGVIGPNGAGKTTLVRILAGEVRPDSGRFELDGEPLTLGVRSGTVALVHQEPQLFPTLTVSENILAGHEGTRIRRPRPDAAQAAIEAELDLTLWRDVPLEALAISIRQRTEIARALVRRAQVFVFDEPNSSLTPDESAEMFRWIHRLADQGFIVLLVSHRLAEVAAHAADAFVIKDGRVEQVIPAAEMSEDRLARSLVSERDVVRRMVGGAPSSSNHGAIVVQSGDDVVTVQASEVTAIVGVEGSGAYAFLRALTAGRPGERPVTLPADRRESLFGNLSVAENMSVRSVSSPVVRRRYIEAIGAGGVDRFNVKVGEVTDPIGTLSGGNQQKVAIAGAILAEPGILVLDEPTRGVDVASRRDIHSVLRLYASGGRIVVAHCSELTEVFELCDRVLVFRDGRLAGDHKVARFGYCRGFGRRCQCARCARVTAPCGAPKVTLAGA